MWLWKINSYHQRKIEFVHHTFVKKKKKTTKKEKNSLSCFLQYCFQFNIVNSGELFLTNTWRKKIVKSKDSFICISFI